MGSSGVFVAYTARESGSSFGPLASGGTCPRAGGLDQNIYGATTP